MTRSPHRTGSTVPSGDELAAHLAEPAAYVRNAEEADLERIRSLSAQRERWLLHVEGRTR